MYHFMCLNWIKFSRIIVNSLHMVLAISFKVNEGNVCYANTKVSTKLLSLHLQYK